MDIDTWTCDTVYDARLVVLKSSPYSLIEYNLQVEFLLLISYSNRFLDFVCSKTLFKLSLLFLVTKVDIHCI